VALNGQKLGELLLEADVLTKRQLQKALAMQASGDKRQIGEILIELGFITLDDLTEIMLVNGHATPKKTTPKPENKSEPIDISEDAVMKTKFALDVKTLIAAAVGISSLVGMWYALQADIQEAKELPNLETLYSEEYPSKPEGYNWPRSYEQYKDNVEGLQDEMDDAFGRIEELEELIKELQKDIKSLERRKRDK
jgi:hypothetical protein